MAPIPTIFDTDAQALLEAIERRQNDLSTFQIPRLRTCIGPLVTQQAWAAEVREDIEQLAKQIEELDVLVDDQRNERARAALRAKVDEHSKVLERLRRDSRAAILASKRAIDAQSRSQREELLRSPSVQQQATSSNEKVTEDALMKANNNVTEALQRTISLMQKELEKSVLSSQLLESSTDNLNSASQTHDTLTLLIGSSKQLVTALEKTDWLDRMLIISALVFFGLVILFILQQRILNRGLKIAFWWTRFVPGMSSRGRTAVETVKEVVVGGDATTSRSLASVVLTATAASSTLGSILVATAPVPEVTLDASATIEVSLDPTLLPESEGAESLSGPLHTPIADRPHIEL